LREFIGIARDVADTETAMWPGDMEVTQMGCSASINTVIAVECRINSLLAVFPLRCNVALRFVEGTPKASGNMMRQGAQPFRSKYFACSLKFSPYLHV